MRYIPGLGLTASHRRIIKPGNQYDRFFQRPQGTDPLLTKSADVFQTVDYIDQLVKQTLSQTAKIAPVIKGSSKDLGEICRKVFNFFYQHYQYKLDKEGEEQLRTPARAWKDRKSGIDCDCFSISVSSVLNNLGIKHAYRICELSNKGYFQHIYIVVPIDQTRNKISGGQYIVIDPVLDRYNTEAPGITKTHDKMSIPVRVLNGVDSELLGSIDEQNTSLGVYNAFKRTLKSHIGKTRAKIKANPRSLGGMYDTHTLLGMLDQAEHVIDNDSDENLVGLYGMEGAEISHPAFEGLEGDGLGKGKFVKKIASAVKSVKTEVKKAASSANPAKAVAKVKQVAKQAVKAVVKYNPVSTAARAGFLLAMSTNMFGIADQVRWGYATSEQIARYGISSSDYSKAKTALAKVTKIFVDELKGQPDNLKKAILSGKQNFQGLDGLGVVAAASTSAALAFIIKARDFIKGMKIVPKLQAAAKTLKDNKDVAKVLKDKAAGFLTKKKPTTIENNTMVEKDSTEQIPTVVLAPENNSGSNTSEVITSYTPVPPTPPTPPTYDEVPMQRSDDNNLIAEETVPDPAPGAPKPAEEKKGMGTGTKIGLAILGILGIGYMATRKKSTKKGLGEVEQTEDLSGTRKNKKTKSKTRTFRTGKGNKVKIAFSGAKKKTAKKLQTIIVK